MTEPTPRRSTGREALAILILAILALLLLGIVWKVVRALLWLLAALLIAFLVFVAWREYKNTGSWAAGVSGSGRIVGSMARGVGRTVTRLFGSGERR